MTQHSDIKEDTIAHYERMIAFAKKQNLTDAPNTAIMEKIIDEKWFSKNCAYCKEYYRMGCGNCPLHIQGSTCCNGLWSKMNYATTWKKWINYAKKIIKYINEHG